MRYERTRRVKTPGAADSLTEYLAAWQASVVVVSGSAAGSEYALDGACVSIGRGPGVDLEFDDSAMSRAHASFEFAQGGFRIHDLGSTNGTLLNDAEVKVAELKNGDRIRIGEHVFQFVLSERERTPKTYTLPDA
jgi:pSer/pThr/pTyr-binding forkhead associated (FHA) protein